MRPIQQSLFDIEGSTPPIKYWPDFFTPKEADKLLQLSRRVSMASKPDEHLRQSKQPTPTRSNVRAIQSSSSINTLVRSHSKPSLGPNGCKKSAIASRRPPDMRTPSPLAITIAPARTPSAITLTMSRT